jgi:hypothetical protein
LGDEKPIISRRSVASEPFSSVALRVYAAEHGDRWKDELRFEWIRETGEPLHLEDGSTVLNLGRS